MNNSESFLRSSDVIPPFEYMHIRENNFQSISPQLRDALTRHGDDKFSLDRQADHYRVVTDATPKMTMGFLIHRQNDSDIRAISIAIRAL